MVGVAKLEWSTERRIVNDLRPYDENPRVMSEDEANELRRSLQRFNLVEIPVIDTKNRIVAGHQRVRLLQMEGRGNEEIEVRVPNRPLTDAEFREYNLRSNRNHGQFDFDKLVNLGSDELLNAGFDEKEIGKHFGDKPPQPASLTVFYQDEDEMREVREAINGFDGKTYAERLLSLVRSK